MTRNYTKQDVQNKLEKVQNQKYVSEHNAELLEEFIDYLRADHNVSTNRQYKYLTGFKTLFEKFIDFPLDNTSKREIRQTVGKIRGSEYSDHTKRDFKVYIKKFYNTYYEDEVDRPDWVKRILGAQFMKLNSNPSRQTEIEALTPEEIMSMVEPADKTRSKLLPLFLFETGARTKIFEGNYDAVISDYDMPEMTGIELLEDIREKNSNLPFVLYTGRGTEEVAANAISKGVTDYYQKEAGTEQYKVIANKIQRSVHNYREKERKEIFEEVVENSENPILVTNHDSEIMYVNPAFENVTGYTEEEVMGENPRILSSGDHPKEVFGEMYESLNNGEDIVIENMTNLDKEGVRYVHDLQIMPISTLDHDEIEYFAGISKVLDKPKTS